MKHDEKEIGALSAVLDQNFSSINELHELELALVGGGVGEVVIA